MSYRIARPSAPAAHRFIREILGQRLWGKQQDIVTSVFSGPHRITAVKSATGVGKTKVAADIALAWLFTGPSRTVLTTAPTARQVTNLLWKEIRRSYKAGCARAKRLHRGLAGGLGGFMPPAGCTLKLDDEWLAIGFSSADEVNLQGWHCAGGTLIILDEAVGVKDAIWDSLEATMTGEHDRLLAIANPTAPSGRFYDLFKQPKSTRPITITAFDSPNVESGTNLIPGLTTRAWIEERRVRWGENSALWAAKVKAEFPDDGDNVLVPLSWVDAAVERWKAMERPTDGVMLVEQGLDVARYGDDANILATTLWTDAGVYVPELVRWAKCDTMETTGRAARLRSEAGASTMRIDADGIGAGVFDRAKELDEPVIEMRGGRASNDPTRFANARSEWMWNLREMLDPSADLPVALPPDDNLVMQATSLRYKEKSNGQIQVESKDDWRKRTKRSSTDELDGVAYALARGAGSAPFAYGSA